MRIGKKYKNFSRRQPCLDLIGLGYGIEAIYMYYHVHRLLLILKKLSEEKNEVSYKFDIRAILTKIDAQNRRKLLQDESTIQTNSGTIRAHNHGKPR